MAKYQMTGCARFFLFLIVFVPLAYFGAKYLRQSGIWDKVQSEVGERVEAPKTDQTKPIPQPKSNTNSSSNNSADLRVLQERVARLEQKISDQNQIIDAQKETITQLKRQLGQTTEVVRKEVEQRKSQENRNPNEAQDVKSLEELLQQAEKSLRKKM